MFTDDCILYYSGNSIHAMMQYELDKFIDWTVKNSLQLNESKTQSMIVGPCGKPCCLNIHERIVDHLLTHPPDERERMQAGRMLIFIKIM